jgi:chemotaxis protein methyltransferase CheR
MKVELQSLSERITREIGIYYPEHRRDILDQRIRSAASDAGAVDVRAFVDELKEKPWDSGQISWIANYLTIPETYFFRDQAAFDLFEDAVLPQLVKKCLRGENVVIWSASCCTGEEPYSLAILLHKHLPQNLLAKVRIVATDINQKYLAQARTGIYSEWSLRTIPKHILRTYFSAKDNGQFELSQAIRDLVRFEYSNLVDQFSLPSNVTPGTADVVFCRNTLIYFSNEQTGRTLSKLAAALAVDGWCFLGPSEVWKAPLELFRLELFPGVIAIRKKDRKALQLASDNSRSDRVLPAARVGSKIAESARRKIEPPDAGTTHIDTLVAPLIKAKRLCDQGAYGEAIQILHSLTESGGMKDERVSRLLIECHMKSGDLGRALECAEKAIAFSKRSSGLYYLQAMLYHETGRDNLAVKSLRQSILLDPSFALAQLMLGNLLRKQCRSSQARVHFENARTLATNLPPDSILQESGGLNAGRFLEIVDAILLELVEK